MFHLDNNSGVSAMPAPAAMQNQTTRWFTEGSGNQSPSWPGQDWFNIVQAELLAILTAAGITPDKTKINQLALAIKTIANKDALLKENCLSEFKAAGAKALATSRDNLGLGNCATLNVGTAKGTVAAGDDLRIVNAFPVTGGTVAGETHFGELVHFDRHDAAVQFSSSGEGMPDIAISYSKAGNFGFWDVNNAGWVLRKDVDNNWVMYEGLSLNGPLKNSGEFQSTSDNSFRMVQGDYGTFWRMDGTSLYLMQTAAGDQYGTYDGSRPLRVNLADGMVEINGARPYSTANPPPAPDLSGYIHGDACNQAGFVSQNGDAPYMMFNGSTIVELARLAWVNDQISAVQNWAGNDLRNDIYNWCNQNFVTAVRLGSERVQASTNDSGGVISLGGGELFTGAAGVGGSDFNKAQWRVRQLQYCINGQWVAAGSI